MSFATINSVRDRLVALLPLVILPSPLDTPLAFKSEAECAFSDEQLPAFIVSSMGGDDEFVSTDNLFYMRREYMIQLFVSRICDESYQEDMDKSDQVNDCIMAVRRFFAARPTLSLNYDQMVESARLGRDVGERTLMTHGSTNKYHGTVFRLAVSFTQVSEQTDE